MTDNNRSARNNRLILSWCTPALFPWLVAFAGIAVLLKIVPLFHIVSLETATKESAKKIFDPQAYVEDFWQVLLQEKSNQASSAHKLAAALRQDSAAAALKYGHTLGLGGSAAYFIAGRGEIIAAGDNTLLIALSEDRELRILIEFGPVFGNAIRDGSGLLNISQFANSQAFNAVSSEINRRVEEDVLPEIKRKAQVGKQVRFLGGVDTFDEKVLTLVPVEMAFL